MNRFAISVAIISTASSLCGEAHAMDIKDYFRMANHDQARFGQTLLENAERLLREQNRSDLAMQLDKLFTEISAGNQISEGTAEYTLNLSEMLKAEIKREANNPNRAQLQAERAFRDVAGDHGITLPAQFENIAASFRPQLPLKP